MEPLAVVHSFLSYLVHGLCLHQLLLVAAVLNGCEGAVDIEAEQVGEQVIPHFPHRRHLVLGAEESRV